MKQMHTLQQQGRRWQFRTRAAPPQRAPALHKAISTETPKGPIPYDKITIGTWC